MTSDNPPPPDNQNAEVPNEVNVDNGGTVPAPAPAATDNDNKKEEEDSEGEPAPEAAVTEQPSAVAVAEDDGHNQEPPPSSANDNVTTDADAAAAAKPARRGTIHMEVGNVMSFDVDVPSDLDLADSTVREQVFHDEEFLKARGDDVEIWFHVRRIKSHTCQCCGIMCGLWVLSFALLLVCSVAFGAIAFDIGVPFYDRAEINQAREDAYLATQRDGDYVATIFQSDGGGVCIHDDPTRMTRNGTLLEGPPPGENCQLASTQHLRLLYISSDRESNILTSENLQQIQKIEEHLLNHPALSKYCRLVASNYSAFTNRDVTDIIGQLEEHANATEANHRSCARINSALNFMDPLYFFPSNGLGYHLLVEDVIPQEYDLEQSNIDEVVDFWSNYETTSYDVSNFPAAVSTIGSMITVPNIFYTVTSTDFTVGATGAVGLVSTLDLGLPINGYASSSQGVTEQYEEVGAWLWEEFDEYLKSASFEGVDVYFQDTEGEMLGTETGVLALASFGLLPLSILFVLSYLIFMQDSFYIGLVGIMQILLCFIPGLVIYTYVFNIKYIGVLNLIAIYIIMGIGVDNLFVFCDQWKHHAHEKRFDQRLQKTFNVASKAMFTTSCTTFIAFISNATSAFPAIRCFGIFAAVLVLVNFCAVFFFFPAAFGVYFKIIRFKWFDHPSRLFCCNRSEYTDDVYVEDPPQSGNVGELKKVPSATGEDALTGSGEEQEEVREGAADAAGEETNKEDSQQEEEHQVTESSLVRFFRDTWAPLIIKMRFVIIVFYLGVLAVAMYYASQIQPDESAPILLPEDNPYRLYTDVLLEHFARSGNPEAITLYWLGGIDPDDPIDRTGTDETNSTDFGNTNFVDCSVYDPTTEEAQVWSLNTCQDMFYGNVTEYHDDSDNWGYLGSHGPQQRKIATERVPHTDEFYYQLVSCPMQGLRDWLLTDSGCSTLQTYGLPCYDETSQRPDCTTWDTNGNSCEPYPIPQEHFFTVMQEFMLDPNFDPNTRQTNYDKYYREVFAAEVPDLNEFQKDKVLKDDFSCRVGDDLVVLSVSSTATLDQSFQQNYEDGIALYELWEEWAAQMRKHAPREMKSVMQTSSFAWSFYYLNQTLLSETYANIVLSLVLSFIVLSVVGGNPLMAFYSVATIGLIVVDVFAFTVLMGFYLGVLEAVNYVVVIGLAIDYTVHLSEAYAESHHEDRTSRVTAMLEAMGVSVLSGAISTLGACFFMFFAPNTFFVRFATFIFATIVLSCVYSLTFFPALLSIVGPTGDFGNCYAFAARRWRQFKHRVAREYIETEEFKRRELKARMKAGEIETLFEC